MCIINQKNPTKIGKKTKTKKMKSDFSSLVVENVFSVPKNFFAVKTAHPAVVQADIYGSTTSQCPWSRTCILVSMSDGNDCRWYIFVPTAGIEILIFICVSNVLDRIFMLSLSFWTLSKQGNLPLSDREDGYDRP